MSDTDQSENLTILERDILTLAVQGEGLDLLLLQKQIDFAKVEKRESSGVGLFVNLKVSVPENVRGYTKRMQLSNVHGECSELSEGFGVTIFVEGGILKLLELYSYGEGWPEQLTNVRLSRIE
jgi:hypothetical protein